MLTQTDWFEAAKFASLVICSFSGAGLIFWWGCAAWDLVLSRFLLRDK